MLKIINPSEYLIGVNSTTGFVILALNSNQIAVYCKFSGQPYKSHFHAEAVARIGVVCGVWTVAYVIKLVAIL